MSGSPSIAVLCGSLSDEAAVSRVSGKAMAEALAEQYSVELVDLQTNELHGSLDPETTVVFPALHGDFGEDGELQALLDSRGFAYAGSNARASALCMNKVAAKTAVAGSGFSFARDVSFEANAAPDASELMTLIGADMVIKPLDKGSSVGLYMAKDMDGVEAVLAQLKTGQWMAEERLRGRELTVGILDGKAMGVVEIVPEGGVYDFEHKYTTGATSYLFPAELDSCITQKIQKAAEEAFSLCGCRDFGRVDIILTDDHRPCFLEINTIPGLTPTSLLPKSASCLGIGFSELAQRMVKPAIERFHQKLSLTHG